MSPLDENEIWEIEMNESLLTDEPFVIHKILEEFKAEPNGVYRRNQIKTLDLFVAAVIYHFGEMNNPTLARICNLNIPLNRVYTADNIFQSRRRHKRLTDANDKENYDVYYNKAYQKIVLADKPGSMVNLFAVPKSIRKKLKNKK